ncbi:MAG: hypothetical protein JWM76_376 [Pseudonocardiales bacterium]|nr:hypothetical protein [Pseudonocardiales bacterium]
MLCQSTHFRDLSTIFTNVAERFAQPVSLADASCVLTATALVTVPGAEHAGLTLITRQTETFATHAATDELVHRVDAAQYALGSGPCVDAVLVDRISHATDLRTDSRWPDFGRQASQLGVVSMLSFRLPLADDAGMIAGLNLYSTQAEAFDEVSETIGMLLATHGALAIAGALARNKAMNLHRALESNREIGAAMGILMTKYKLTREEAFKVLRITSQDANRKVAALATEVVDTGTINLSRRLSPQR